MKSRLMACALPFVWAACGGTPQDSPPAVNAPAVEAAPPTVPLHIRFDPSAAYAYTKQVVAFGERPPGSAAHEKTQRLIRDVLGRNGATIDTDEFTAETPRGPIPVRTIIGKFNRRRGSPQPIIVLAGHYDTLFQRGFVGANDGGSSTAILLALADALKDQPTNAQIWLVWTDLEEAVVGFSDRDGLYGSRHLAARLRAEGVVPRVKAFFLLDMIGDRDLQITRERQSTRWLQDFIEHAAAQLGYGEHFFHREMDITDDHVPFLDAGIPAVDVVDAEFGRMGPAFDAMGEFHHANTDTLDKVSERSLEIVGRTILLTVELLDR